MDRWPGICRTKSGPLISGRWEPRQARAVALAGRRRAPACHATSGGGRRGRSRHLAYTEKWGNVLRGQPGDFGGFSVEKYLRRAPILNPADTSPRLNMAVAFLDRVEYAPAPAEPFHLLVALGATVGLPVLDIERRPVSPASRRWIASAPAHSGHAEDGEAFRRAHDSRDGRTVTVAGSAHAGRSGRSPAGRRLPS